jgi:drug/metabolite transporter (DMT)-like permease
VAFSGAILCSVDEGKEAARSKQYTDDEEDSMKVDLSTMGDLLALASAVLGVFYLTAAKALRPHMSVTIFMFLIMVCGSFIVLLYMLISGVHLTFDNNPMHGLFGWCNIRVDRFWLQLWIVLVCNLLGTMGFVRAMQQFDTLVIAVATLLEPMAASVIAYTLAVGLLPGFMGWIGNLLVAVGTFAVVYPSVHKGDGGGGH